MKECNIFIPGAWFIKKCLLNLCLSIQVLHKMSNVSDQELEKRQQLAELRNELQHISMVDEFPRYARLQRNITKLSDEVTKYSKYN